MLKRYFVMPLKFLESCAVQAAFVLGRVWIKENDVVTINTISPNSNLSTTNTVEKTRSATNVDTGTAVATAGQSTAVSTLSTLARQLSEASTRATLRDSSLSFKELGQHAARIADEVAGTHYYLNQDKNDAEVPDTDDTYLLARALKATAFVNDIGTNPFHGMSRDQLSLIIYDEGGEFTVNERRAAWSESYRQEEVWRRQVIQRSTDEYNATGKRTNFFEQILEHYKSLPPIEQTQYPEGYASDLQQDINFDFKYLTDKAEGQRKFLSLVEFLSQNALKANG
ncbi:MAG: hypothetical protein ACRESJ_05830 [Pseudomonas sp.]|uniref:hypothetical protein n=1 Tax=Pseudomonas sp. TaxID=306 RepID=UPI003D6FC5D0